MWSVETSLNLCTGQFTSTNKQRKGKNVQNRRKKGHLGIKYRKHLLSSIQKTKSAQTSGSFFAERMEQVRGTELELELIKTVDRFLDGHRSYSSDLVTFE